MRIAVDTVLSAVGAERREQVALAAWTADEKKASEHALTLQQIKSGVVVPPSGWKCAKCDKKENLWLNLTDGMILCGRKNWDGTGGNNHAVEHYKETSYPLAVKLGTITADLESAGNGNLSCFLNLFGDWNRREVIPFGQMLYVVGISYVHYQNKDESVFTVVNR